MKVLPFFNFKVPPASHKNVSTCFAWNIDSFSELEKVKISFSRTEAICHFAVASFTFMVRLNVSSASFKKQCICVYRYVPGWDVKAVLSLSFMLLSRCLYVLFASRTGGIADWVRKSIQTPILCTGYAIWVTVFGLRSSTQKRRIHPSGGKHDWSRSICYGWFGNLWLANFSILTFSKSQAWGPAWYGAISTDSAPKTRLNRFSTAQFYPGWSSKFSVSFKRCFGTGSISLSSLLVVAILSSFCSSQETGSLRHVSFGPLRSSYFCHEQCQFQ